MDSSQVRDLLGAAGASPWGGANLTGDLGAVVVAGASGMDTEDIQASDVTLVTVLVDASSSIANANLEEAVRDGQNQLVDAFSGAREKDSILLAQWTFNSEITVLHSYVPVGDAARLDARNYAGLGATRLYDTWVSALTANVAYAEKLRENGTPCKSVVVVITDGGDYGSRTTAAACGRLSKALLAKEQFELAFVGVGDATDFRAVARRMGVPERSIAIATQATPSNIRKLFLMVSQSAIRASARAVGPGQSQGFFTP